MKPEGPSLLSWLVGRVLYPPARGACARCGARGGDLEAASRLGEASAGGIAELAALCPKCRRVELQRRAGAALVDRSQTPTSGDG